MPRCTLAKGADEGQRSGGLTFRHAIGAFVTSVWSATLAANQYYEKLLEL